MCLTVPGRILRIEAADPEIRSAEVDFGGAHRQVSLLYTPDATVGSYVIVHAGFATEVLPEDEAREALEYVRQLSAGEAARPLATTDHT